MKNFLIDLYLVEEGLDEIFPCGFFIRAKNFSACVSLEEKNKFSCSFSDKKKEYYLEGDKNLLLAFFAFLQKRFGSQIINELFDKIFDKLNPFLNKYFVNNVPSRKKIKTISDPDKELEKYLVEE